MNSLKIMKGKIEALPLRGFVRGVLYPAIAEVAVDPGASGAVAKNPANALELSAGDCRK